jgi:hypothetical protein
MGALSRPSGPPGFRRLGLKVSPEARREAPWMPQCVPARAKAIMAKTALRLAL